jgi:hypothetical protein
MAYTVTNNPWTSQYSVGIGTDTGLDAKLNVVTPSAKAYNPSTYNGSNNAIRINSGATITTGTTVGMSIGIGGSAEAYIGAVQNSSGYADMVFQNYNGSSYGERMRITSGGNVGIGTDSPDTLLDATLGLSVYSSTGRAGIALAGNTTTADEVLGRVCFTNNNSTNAGNKRLAYISGIRGTTNNSAYLEFATANDALGTQRMIITQSGGVGIGTSTPGTYKLNVNGTFYSAGSSLEYKTDITTLDIDTNKILELRPVTYQYKDEYKHLGKELKSGTQIGLIAEEVAEVFPELAMMKEDEDGEIRVRNVDYEKLSILLLSEIQKLRKEVNELKNI